jgi:hypothetical protein
MSTRITKAIADYQHEISPTGVKGAQAIYKKHGIPGGSRSAADIKFDAMVTLREVLTEEIERRPADLRTAA